MKCRVELRFLYPALGVKSLSDPGTLFTLCSGNNNFLLLPFSQSHREGLANLCQKLLFGTVTVIVSVSSLAFKHPLNCTYLVA